MKLTLIVLLLAMTGCAKHATAPVPGSIDPLDAWAYRIISDSTASIHSVKIWEQCSSVTPMPVTVSVDGATEICDTKAGPFPMQFKPQLNLAITSLNTASAAGKTYHSGASNDAAGLTSAVSQLTNAVTSLISSIGSSK